MKKKHGFIGNSSSASYYIRRGAKADHKGTADGTTFPVTLTGGQTYDGAYKWHPANKFDMTSVVDIPISGGDNVTGLTFDFGALVRSGIVGDILPTNMDQKTAGALLYLEDSATVSFVGVGTCVAAAPAGNPQGIPEGDLYVWQYTLDDDDITGVFPASGITITIDWNGNRLRILNRVATTSAPVSASSSTYINNVKIQGNN